MKFKVLKKKSLSGSRAIVRVGDKVIGEITNITFGPSHSVCTCNSKAAKGALGHKETCPWWMFADEDTGLEFEHVLGRQTPSELYNSCGRCAAWQDSMTDQICPDHMLVQNGYVKYK